MSTAHARVEPVRTETDPTKLQHLDGARMWDLLKAYEEMWECKTPLLSLTHTMSDLRWRIYARAGELFEAAKDPHHGEDREVEQETRAFLLWTHLRPEQGQR